MPGCFTNFFKFCRMLSKLNWLQTVALAVMAGLVWLKVIFQIFLIVHIISEKKCVGSNQLIILNMRLLHCFVMSSCTYLERGLISFLFVTYHKDQLLSWTGGRPVETCVTQKMNFTRVLISSRDIPQKSWRACNFFNFGFSIDDDDTYFPLQMWLINSGSERCIQFCMEYAVEVTEQGKNNHLYSEGHHQSKFVWKMNQKKEFITSQDRTMDIIWQLLHSLHYLQPSIQSCYCFSCFSFSIL